MKLYKVLKVKMDLRAGTLKVQPTMMATNYSDYLPVNDNNPGRWTREAKNPVRCQSGWHLTTHPSSHIGRDSLTSSWGYRQFYVVYLAEGRKPVAGNSSYEKQCYGQIRLIREVKRADWPQEWLDKAAGKQP